jgi:GNAT superfamily N-acetyltransferase
VAERAQVRLASAEDAGEIARLLHAFDLEYDTPAPGEAVLTERSRSLLAEGEMAVVLAGAPAAGVAVLRFRRSLWTEAHDALDAYLEELYVTPERRGEGLGRALLESAMRAARNRGAVRMEIGTSTADTAAIGLYESAGFTNLEDGEDGPSMLFYERDL